MGFTYVQIEQVSSFVEYILKWAIVDYDLGYARVLWRTSLNLDFIQIFCHGTNLSSVPI